jgi:hypothetical protein
MLVFNDCADRIAWHLPETPLMNAPHRAQSDEPISFSGLPLLYQTIYCSRTTAGVDEAAVARIIAEARRMNPARGITGLLVCGGGVFFQWIEGPRDNVMHLMDRIRADPRHEHVVMLSETEEVRERLFPEWDMELVSASEIRDVLIDALTDAEDEKNTASLSLILAHLEAGGIAELGAVA